MWNGSSNKHPDAISQVHSTHFRTFAICILFISSIIPGCGRSDDGLARIPVSGTVTIDGEPVTEGSLSLTPQTFGPACGASVFDGQFDIPRNRGPVAGAYNARVTVNAGKSSMQADATSTLPTQYEPIVVTIVDDGESVELQFTAER